MEVTHESHIEEIREALELTGSPAGVMLQIGTRNTQNFELLKLVGRQQEFPVLLKRGFGITLDESLNAAEYLASEGNRKVVFGLRGMKTNIGDPHRNFVDFAHVPVVKRLTRMPVCVDPSHSVAKLKVLRVNSFVEAHWRLHSNSSRIPTLNFLFWEACLFWDTPALAETPCPDQDRAAIYRTDLSGTEQGVFYRTGCSAESRGVLTRTGCSD